MPGGGVRSTNVNSFIDEDVFTEIHSAAILQGEVADKDEIKKLVSMIK